MMATARNLLDDKDRNKSENQKSTSADEPNESERIEDSALSRISEKSGEENSQMDVSNMT
jgi:hypothetical protein